MKSCLFALVLTTITPAFASSTSFDPEARLAELHIELHKPTPPVANYVNAVRTGNLVYLAGHGPHKPDGKLLYTGKVGKELTLEQGPKSSTTNCD